MKQIKFLPLAIFTVLAASAAPTYASDAVGLSTSWQSTFMSERECMQRGESAFRNSGFSEIEFVGQSIFGDNGAYTGTIRCVESNEIVFFVVAGPSADRAGNLRERLASNF